MTRMQNRASKTVKLFWVCLCTYLWIAALATGEEPIFGAVFSNQGGSSGPTTSDKLDDDYIEVGYSGCLSGNSVSCDFAVGTNHVSGQTSVIPFVDSNLWVSVGQTKRFKLEPGIIYTCSFTTPQSPNFFNYFPNYQASGLFRSACNVIVEAGGDAFGTEGTDSYPFTPPGFNFVRPTASFQVYVPKAQGTLAIHPRQEPFINTSFGTAYSIGMVMEIKATVQITPPTEAATNAFAVRIVQDSQHIYRNDFIHPMPGIDGNSHNGVINDTNVWSLDGIWPSPGDERATDYHEEISPGLITVTVGDHIGFDSDHYILSGAESYSSYMEETRMIASLADYLQVSPKLCPDATWRTVDRKEWHIALFAPLERTLFGRSSVGNFHGPSEPIITGILIDEDHAPNKYQ